MWNKAALEAFLDERIVVADAAIGTELYGQGFDFAHTFDALNLSHPLVVRRVHRSYVAAGARIITTNTFGANRLRLERDHLTDRVREINRAGVDIARDAAQDRPPWNRPLVAGSVGPLGRPLQPVGKLTEVEARAAFREQLGSLLAADPDLIVFETFSDLRELCFAAEELTRLAPDAAFAAFATFTEEGKTLLGNKPEEVVRAMLERGAAVIGANCSMGPQGLEEVGERMLRVPGARIALRPNAGLPRLVGGRYIYVNLPEYFSEWAARMADLGICMVGGCCGTTPAHVAAMRDAIGVRAPVARVVDATLPVVTRNDSEPAQSARLEGDASDCDWSDSDFERKLCRGEFVVSVELDPPRGIQTERLVQGAVACRQAGIDAINIADSPLATARMSPLALAVLIREQVDIEILLHVSCRDRNVLGLIGETMGAHALGIRHMLCVTGDPPALGDYPGSHGVFEIDSVGLLGLLDRLNHGRNASGQPNRFATDFRLSCAVNPTAVNLDLEIERFHRKVDAGARFALTQPLYDFGDLERFVERAQPTIPLLVGILPLRNARHAHFIHHEVPGMAVPAAIRGRMEAAGAAGAEEGVAIGREFLAQIRSHVAGVYLMPPFNKFEMAIDIVQGSAT